LKSGISGEVSYDTTKILPWRTLVNRVNDDVDGFKLLQYGFQYLQKISQTGLSTISEKLLEAIRYNTRLTAESFDHPFQE